MKESPAEFLNGRRFTVLFSGGRDSLAALLWVLDNVKHEKWNVLYVEVTGNTHPLCNEYVHEVCEELGVGYKLIHARREDLDFFEALKRWGIPVIGKYRWCLHQFKIRCMRGRSHPTQVTGVKRSDSPRRRSVGPVAVAGLSGYVTVNPLYDWEGRDVLNYIKRHDVPINPCYEIYGHSGNCMICPYFSKKEIYRTLQDPEWRARIVGALKAVRAERSEWMRRVRDKWLWMASQLPLTGALR